MFTKSVFACLAMIVFGAFGAWATPAERQLSIREQAEITAGFGGAKCAGPFYCTDPVPNAYTGWPRFECVGKIVHMEYVCATPGSYTCTLSCPTWCYAYAMKYNCSLSDCVNLESGWDHVDTPHGEAKQDCENK